MLDDTLEVVKRYHSRRSRGEATIKPSQVVEEAINRYCNHFIILHKEKARCSEEKEHLNEEGLKRRAKNQRFYYFSQNTGLSPDELQALFRRLGLKIKALNRLVVANARLGARCSRLERFLLVGLGTLNNAKRSLGDKEGPPGAQQGK